MWKPSAPSLWAVTEDRPYAMNTNKQTALRPGSILCLLQISPHRREWRGKSDVRNTRKMDSRFHGMTRGSVDSASFRGQRSTAIMSPLIVVWAHPRDKGPSTRGLVSQRVKSPLVPLWRKGETGDHSGSPLRFHWEFSFSSFLSSRFSAVLRLCARQSSIFCCGSAALCGFATWRHGSVTLCAR
jgi:hypothetical protein